MCALASTAAASSDGLSALPSRAAARTRASSALSCGFLLPRKAVFNQWQARLVRVILQRANGGAARLVQLWKTAATWPAPSPVRARMRCCDPHPRRRRAWRLGATDRVNTFVAFEYRNLLAAILTRLPTGPAKNAAVRSSAVTMALFRASMRASSRRWRWLWPRGGQRVDVSADEKRSKRNRLSNRQYKKNLAD